MPITLPDDATEKALVSIRRYASAQLEVEMGELQARLLLEFFLKELAPPIYNAAIADAQTWVRDRVSDLEGACFETEFAYWPKGTARKPGR